jgi:glycosyltransferase involved in cell wall biosynthesis
LAKVLRVAHLLPNLALGGRERLANMLCETGAAHGLEAMLIGYDPLPDTAASFTPAAPYRQLDRTGPDFLPQLRQLLREHRIDVVHAQGHIPACYLAQALQSMPDAPASVATMHVGLQGTWRWLWPIRQGLRAMGHLSAVSHDMARTYARLAGKPVAHRPNGVDCRHFAQITPKAPDGGPFRFAMVSRIDRVKRHVDAVAACDMLHARGQRIELHIAGEGPVGRRLAAMAQTRPWLRLAGAIDDPARFLQDMHAFLMPSQAEGMPLALAEAMACGMPCVVSDLPSLRRMAQDGALYAKAGSPDDLARQMIHLTHDQGLCADVGARARRLVQAFDAHGCARDYAAIYRRLCAP